jgi:two-component system, LytTR family, sensor kinase
MTRRQLIVAYSAAIFMMAWGLDIITLAKFKEPISVETFYSPFHFSQIIYALATLMLTHRLYKKYYSAKRYVSLALVTFGLVLFFIAFRYLLEEALYPALFSIQNYNPSTAISYYALDNVYYALIYVLLGVLIFLIDIQVANQKKQVLLQQQNREAELQFLRSQINPHFLFNTLNNIYSLVYERSIHAPAAMLQLSGLVRYMLYEKTEAVPVSKEWKYIESFINLQKLRYHELPVSLSLQGNADSLIIPPYLLIPFIENAFKHGDFKDPFSPLQVELKITDKQLVFQIKNKTAPKEKEEGGGIGLDNVKRRLDLLFPGRHELQIINSGNWFSAYLLLEF